MAKPSKMIQEVAKELLKKDKGGKTEFDFGYRAYLREMSGGRDGSHLMKQFKGDKQKGAKKAWDALLEAAKSKKGASEYEILKKEKERLSGIVDSLSKKLNSYPKGKGGLVPEDVRMSSGYRKDKAAYDKAFKKMQDFNKKIPAKIQRQMAREKRGFEMDKIAAELVSIAKDLTAGDDLSDKLSKTDWYKKMSTPVEKAAAKLLPWGWFEVANVLAEGNSFEVGERQIPTKSVVKGKDLDLLNDNGIVIVRNPRRVQEIVKRMKISKDLTAASDIDLNKGFVKVYRETVNKIASELKKVKGVESVNISERARPSYMTYVINTKGYTRSDFEGSYDVSFLFYIGDKSNAMCFGSRPDWGSSTKLVDEDFTTVVPVSKIIGGATHLYS